MKTLFKLSLIFTLAVCSRHIAANDQNFYVNIRGASSQIDSVKKRSDYRMTKNVDFCRGVKMPKPLSGWKCQNRDGISACSKQYKCEFVDKKFNRKSESLRTYNILKTAAPITTAYTIALSGKPKMMVAKAAPKVAAQVTKPVAKKMAPRPVKTPIPSAPSPTKVEDEDLMALFEEQPMPAETVQEESFEEETSSFAAAEEEKEEESPKDDWVTQWSWLRFDGFLTQTSDESGSQTALEVGWRPRVRFSARWSLDGRLGLSQRKPVADSEELAFSVLEYGAWLSRYLGNWHLAGGFGKQSWSGEGEIGTQSPTFFSVGLGYFWSDVKLYVVEGIEFQFLSLSDEASSKVMRLGFLINF